MASFSSTLRKRPKMKTFSRRFSVFFIAFNLGLLAIAQADQTPRSFPKASDVEGVPDYVAFNYINSLQAVVKHSTDVEELKAIVHFSDELLNENNQNSSERFYENRHDGARERAAKSLHINGLLRLFEVSELEERQFVIWMFDLHRQDWGSVNDAFEIFNARLNTTPSPNLATLDRYIHFFDMLARAYQAEYSSASAEARRLNEMSEHLGDQFEFYASNCRVSMETANRYKSIARSIKVRSFTSAANSSVPQVSSIPQD